MLPVTISGFGIREGGWIYFLGLYGVAPAEAFALSLLTFARTLFHAMIGFVLELQSLFVAKDMGFADVPDPGSRTESQ
jgi:hypothetical protein